MPRFLSKMSFLNKSDKNIKETYKESIGDEVNKCQSEQVVPLMDDSALPTKTLSKSKSLMNVHDSQEHNGAPKAKGFMVVVSEALPIKKIDVIKSPLSKSLAPKSPTVKHYDKLKPDEHITPVLTPISAKKGDLGFKSPLGFKIPIDQVHNIKSPEMHPSTPTFYVKPIRGNTDSNLETNSAKLPLKSPRMNEEFKLTKACVVSKGGDIKSYCSSPIAPSPRQYKQDEHSDTASARSGAVTPREDQDRDLLVNLAGKKGLVGKGKFVNTEMVLEEVAPGMAPFLGIIGINNDFFNDDEFDSGSFDDF